jgi:hypothetical protein
MEAFVTVTSQSTGKESRNGIEVVVVFGNGVRE